MTTVDYPGCGKRGMRLTLHWLAAVAMLLSASGAMAGDGNIEAGKIKTVLCAACHAKDGISINLNWPNLAGQKETYLIKQLKDFREGRRGGEVMPDYTQKLSDQDIEDLAAYYSSLKPCARRSRGDTPTADIEGTDIGAGRKMAASSCVSCHGEKGLSNNEQWPNLAGQKYNYLVQQLKDFRDGTRTDPTMSPIAEPLTDKEIENLAAYYSRLTPCR